MLHISNGSDICSGADKECANCVWGINIMIVLKCVRTYGPDQLYSVQDQLNQIECKSVSMCFDAERSTNSTIPNCKQTVGEETLYENWIPTHIELRFNDSIDETVWAMKNADVIQNGIAINWGCDVITRTVPSFHIVESQRDNAVIRVKELN
mgnify:FL=1